MKKLFILAFCVILTNTMLAQTPKGFSYQAIIRNAEGQPIVSQKVGLKITIQDALGTPYYTETHSPTTSPLGVVSVVVGAGEGKPLDFASIPWEEGSLFLKLGVDLTGGDNYTPIGESMLQAVPYALHAQKASEFVSSGTGSADDPLFAVRNDLGQIVFAVYQTGVRVYVEDDGKKSARGGFAVGGLSYENKQTVEYLRVTPDSVRINIVRPSVVGKSARGGFAVGGLSYENKALPNDLLFISPEKARIYVDPSGSKSARGGFAVGGLSYENKQDEGNFLFLTPENYFIGHKAGSSATTGQFNSFIGYEAGLSNTEGKNGIFIGYRAGMKNTTGFYNTFIGNYAGGNNTIGTQNVFIGDSAGIKNINGNRNIFFGNLSGKENISGEDNVAIGTQAGMANSSGTRNIFLGTQAGFSNTTGRLNIFLGVVSGPQNTTGERNIFIGQGSGFSNKTASYNVFIGDRGGMNNTTGESNVFIGWQSGAGNKTGHGNVYIGELTALNNQEGNNNVYIGRYAGKSSSGDNNVFIGPEAGLYESSSNKLHIANNGSNSLIYGEFDNQKLEINGSVKLTSILNLKPQSTAPGKPEAGDVFYDANTSSIKFFNGFQWMELSATASASPPFVETLEVPTVNLTFDGCLVNYLISNQGSSTIIESGVLYSTLPFLDFESAIKLTSSTTGIGELDVSISGLSVLTEYYVRSYATNSQGTALGNMISFTTPDYPVPTVTSSPVINITQTTATAGGDVTKEGDVEVTERGVCWSTNPWPSLADNTIVSGSGLGTFTCEITGLTTETTYYVRAYATNSIATSYGKEVVFTTAPEEMTVNDADNNVYNIVQIGTQTWMKENLRTTKYNDGTIIPLVTDNTAWSELTSPAYCWYNNEQATYGNTYGALYNWFAVDIGKLCPIGWHVPNSDYEWWKLIDYLGGFELAGGKLKETGTTHWAHPNFDATNETQFTALPGGYRDNNGIFNALGNFGYWFSETETSHDTNRVWIRTMNFSSGSANRSTFFKEWGASVRCLKD